MTKTDNKRKTYKNRNVYINYGINLTQQTITKATNYLISRETGKGL